MAVERDKSRGEGILLRMSTRDSVPLNELLFSVEDSLTYNKTSTENNLVLLWVLRF